MGQKLEALFPADEYQTIPAGKHWAGALLLSKSRDPQSLGFHFDQPNPVAYRDIETSETIFTGFLRVPWGKNESYDARIWIGIDDDKESPSTRISIELPIKNLHSQFWRYAGEAFHQWKKWVDEDLPKQKIHTDWRVKHQDVNLEAIIELTYENNVTFEKSAYPYLSYIMQGADRNVLMDVLDAGQQIYQYAYQYFDFINREGIDQMITDEEKQYLQPPTPLVKTFITDSRVKRVVEFGDQRFWRESMKQVKPNQCFAEVKLLQIPDVSLEIVHQIDWDTREDRIVIFIFDNYFSFKNYQELFAFIDRNRRLIDTMSQKNKPFNHTELSWEIQPQRKQKDILGFYYKLTNQELNVLRRQQSDKPQLTDPQIARQLLNSAIEMVIGLRKNLIK
jgi:hypothetical protein